MMYRFKGPSPINQPIPVKSPGLFWFRQVEVLALMHPSRFIPTWLHSKTAESGVCILAVQGYGGVSFIWERRLAKHSSIEMTMSKPQISVFMPPFDPGLKLGNGMMTFLPLGSPKMSSNSYSNVFTLNDSCNLELGLQSCVAIWSTTNVGHFGDLFIGNFPQMSLSKLRCVFQ